MKFGSFATEAIADILSDASAGPVILAHSLTLPPEDPNKGGKGRKIPKGTRLTPSLIAGIQGAGIASVICARLEATDIHEDEAAARIAAALAGPGIRAAEPFTGRANLFAEQAGILVLDRDSLNIVNALDEGMTVATLEPYASVLPRRMLATIKVIPFGLPADLVDHVVKLITEQHAEMAVAPFTVKRVGLIQTELPQTASAMLDKTRTITEARVGQYGASITFERRVGHDANELATALREGLAPQPDGESLDLIAVTGASAIVDRGDVIPAAIEQEGGRVVQFGMPVDPGNLILFGRADDGRPVLGLPGCARSPALNGLDWVIARLCADLPMGAAELRAMGVGGLLKETGARMQPRAGGKQALEHPEAPQVAAILLAAGLSRRMGARDKLTLQRDGKPLVAHAARALVSAKQEAVLGSLIAVTGPKGEAVGAALAEQGFTLVQNPDPTAGLSSSLKRGLAALPEATGAVLVALGDMPDVSPKVIARLVSAFDPVEGRSICIPTFTGKRGNPVLIDAALIPELMEIEGDIGAKAVIARDPSRVVEVAMDDLEGGIGQGILRDVDTPEAAARWERT